MAMMSCAMAQDTLPGGFRPMSAFASYGVFTSMMANSMRMTLINNDVNPHANAFFIMLAAHDGPETGEDGPTHHGLFWMSLFTAYPGIKVYKPLDANEAVEMLFHAVSAASPWPSSVVRPGVPVFKRGDGVPPASRSGQRRLRLQAVPRKRKAQAGAGRLWGTGDGQRPYILPDIEETADVKIVAVTSPQLFEELRRDRPAQGERRSSPTKSASTWWRCTTAGAASYTHSCCRRTTSAALLESSGSCVRASPPKSTKMPASTPPACATRFWER